MIYHLYHLCNFSLILKFKGLFYDSPQADNICLTHQHFILLQGSQGNLTLNYSHISWYIFWYWASQVSLLEPSKELYQNISVAQVLVARARIKTTKHSHKQIHWSFQQHLPALPQNEHLLEALLSKYHVLVGMLVIQHSRN